MAAKHRRRSPTQPERQRGAHRKGSSASAPVCAACGTDEAGDGLVRIVGLDGEGWMPDERGRLRGPALEIHCTAACVSRLPSALEGSDRQPRLPIDSRALYATLDAWLAKAVLDALSRVAAAGQVVGGHDVLREALIAGEVAHVLVSREAAPRTRRSLERSAPAGVMFHTLDLDLASLGDRVGQRPRAAVGIPSTRAAAPLRHRLAMQRALRGSDSG